MTEREYEIVTARAQVDAIRAILMAFIPPSDIITSEDTKPLHKMLSDWRARLYADELIEVDA